LTQENAIVKKNTCIGLFAVVVWAFAAILAVKLTNIPPFELIFLQFLAAFSTVLIRCSVSKEKPTFFNFHYRDLAIASIALIANQFCYFTAFRYAPAVQVDLINYLWPTLLILFSSFLPKEKACFSYLIACLFSMYGVYTLLSDGDSLPDILPEHITGYLLALGAALSWASYSLYSRYRKSANSANTISWACGPAALASLLIHLSSEKFIVPTQSEAILICLSGVFQTGIAYYFWERGIKKGCVKILGLSSYSIPIFSVLLLILFGKARFEPRMIKATIIISLSPLIPLIVQKIKSINFIATEEKQESSQLAASKNN